MMRVFAAECGRIFRPVRVVCVLLVFLFFLVYLMPQVVWSADVPLAARAAQLIAERYGTHLDAGERSVIEDELFAQCRSELALRMQENAAFVAAGISSYDAYNFLRYDKARLAVMSEEEKQSCSDAHFLLNFGVGKDYDATLSEAEKQLLALSEEGQGEVGAILFDCLVLQRMEDWVTFWYDDRERLAAMQTEEDAHTQQLLQDYLAVGNYTGNMPCEVSETVGQSFQLTGVAVVFAVFLLTSLSPCIDTSTRADQLQAATKTGKRILGKQLLGTLSVAALLSVCGVGAVGLFLHTKIPAALWACPINSYQSWFTVYVCNVSLRSYFWLTALLLVLLVFACSLLAFAVSLLAKSYTALCAMLLPLFVGAQWLCNLLFRIPFSFKQSLQGPLYFSRIFPTPMAEIPVCACLLAAGAVCCVLALRKRKKEFSDFS